MNLININSKMKNVKSNKSYNNKNNIKTEEVLNKQKIYFQNNYVYEKNFANERYNNNLTKFSNEIIDDAIKNEYGNINQMNNEEQLNTQNLLSNKLNNSNKMISEFIFKNNIFFNEEMDEKNNEDKSTFGQFWKREKMFQNKLNFNRDKMTRNLNEELLSKMQDKPNIDEKSREILKKKKKGKTKNIITEGSNKEKIQLINIEHNINIQTNVNDDKKNKNKYSLKKKKSTNKKLEINNEDTESNKIKRIKSESNIKIKIIKSEPKLSESKINKHIKISKSYKFLYMNRIKEKWNFDALIKFNMVSACFKMKKIEINKINEEINDLCNKKIDFYSFCQMLYHFGFVNIKHEKDNIMKYNEIDKNEKIIDNILIRKYFDEDLITKEFIFNEIKIIKKAFKSIHESFKIPKYESINLGTEYNMELKLSDINFSIPIANFKLFIFILTNLFEGLDKEDIIILKEKKKYVEKENKNENISKENEIKSVKIMVFDLIKKITFIKNIEKFTTDFINDFKNCFSYMIKTYENYKYFSNIQNKEIINKHKEEFFKNINEFSFKPTINKEEAINYIKENRNNISENEENKIFKIKKVKNLNEDNENLFPFKPQINSPDLKKIFKNSVYKANSSLKNRSKKFLGSHSNLEANIGKNKNRNQNNRISKDLKDNFEEKDMNNINLKKKLY